MVAFTVHGSAQPAGSKKAYVVNGKAIITDANKKAKPWKQEVAAVAEEAMEGRELFAGPVELEVVIVVPRPAGHFKKDGELSLEGTRNPWPAKRPDITKLLRGIEDAMTGIVWRDDAQVVNQRAAKIYGERAHVTVTVEELA